MALDWGAKKLAGAFELRALSWDRYAPGLREARFFLRLRWRALLRQMDRRHLRNNELILTIFAGVIGFIVGLGVVAVRESMQFLHRVNFDLDGYHLLSEGIGLTWWKVLIVPCIGGLAVGATTTHSARGFITSDTNVPAQESVGTRLTSSSVTMPTRSAPSTTG